MSSIENKGEILKIPREEHPIMWKIKSIRVAAGKVEAWNVIFKALKDCNYQCRLLYPTKLSFVTEKERKTFSEKHKPK